MRNDYVDFWAALGALNAGAIQAPVEYHLELEDLFMPALGAGGYFGSMCEAPVVLSETDEALLELIDRLDLAEAEAEQIKQIRFLVQECGANINAQKDDSVLWKAIEADSPALVKAVLELGGNINQKPHRHSMPGILYYTADLHKVNTPGIVGELCLAGASLPEFWKKDIYPPKSITKKSSYYETLKMVLKYSVDLNGSIFDEPLRTFVDFSRFDKDQFNWVIQFEIIKLFMEKGASLFYESGPAFNCVAENLIKDAIHERGALLLVCDLLQHISSVEKRLDALSYFSAQSEKIASRQGCYFHSPNILKFKQMLDDQILAIKQIRMVSRLLQQGFNQQSSNLNVLNPDVLLEIAARSTEKLKALPVELARKTAHTFFARPPTAYTDGHSPLPLALRYDKANSDAKSPWPIICKDNSRPKFGKY
jgi:hypothetical protein